MITTLFSVEGMACEHCVRAITQAVEAQPGVSSVKVDLSAKAVTVQHDPSVLPTEALRAAIEEAGYEVVG